MDENKTNESAWKDRDFIASWDERTEREKSIRDMQVKSVVYAIPHSKQESIRILDLGAGWGALAAAVLDDRPNASAVCYDGSEEMIALGRERNARFAGRIEFVLGPLDAPDWTKRVSGPFDAVISARALHHLTHEQRRRLFREAYALVRPGGCFVNSDSLHAESETLKQRYRDIRQRWVNGGKESGPAEPQRVRLPHGAHYNGSMEEELSWLREAGFRDVDVFWKFTSYAVYGGFR